MKKQFAFVVGLVLLSVASFGQGKLKVESETKDFGKIPQNKPVTYDFVVTNTGNAPVVINNVSASCGCTTPKWSNEPVMPGKSTKVSATYNAASAGGFNKAITVYSNSENSVMMMYLKGEVTPNTEAATTVSAAPVQPAIVKTTVEPATAATPVVQKEAKKKPCPKGKVC